MNTAGISIFIQQVDGRLSVHHVITGDVPPMVAANACRAIADTIDRERIAAELAAEQEGDDVEGL